MTVFIIVLVLLTVAALVFLIPPLVKQGGRARVVERSDLNVSIYRDQMTELERDLQNDVISAEQYEQGRQELERRLLEDVPGGEARDTGDAGAATGRAGLGGALVVAVAVPALAAGIYTWLGTPAAISPEQAAARSAAAGSSADGVAQQINQMVARLEQRLQEEPEDAEGWAMLGRSYLVLERFGDARKALEKAVSLDDSDPQVLVDYADALAMTTGQSLEGRPMEMIRRALALDPDNQKALWLSGTAAYERADYGAALEYWQRLYDQVPKDSQAARAMESNIAEARALLNGESPARTEERGAAASGQAGASDQATVPGQGGATVTGTVRLAEGLRGRAEASDMVFIFARAARGPRMPLAVMRARVGDLPLDYALDDSMAMDPSMSLSKFSEVVVVARISKSGSAMAKSGDLQGMTPVIRTGTDAAQVVIDEVVP